MVNKSGLFLGILANIIWGTSFFATKITLSVWGPFTSSALRFALALVGMLLIFNFLKIKITKPKNLVQWRQVFLIALSGFGILYPLQLFGMQWISTSLTASIMLTSPLFVVVLSATFLREELSLQKIIAILIGFVGGIILIGPSSLIESNVTLSGLNSLLKGTLFIIAAAISLALSVVLTRPLARELDSKSITFWSMCMGEIFFLIFSLFENKPVGSGPVTTQAIMALIYLALVCSVLAFILWNQAIIKSSPQEIASTMHVKTPVAIIIGHLLAGEALTVTIIAGCLCISFAIWFSQTTFKRWSAT